MNSLWLNWKEYRLLPGKFFKHLRLQFFPTLSKNCTSGLKISSRFMHLFMFWDVLKIDRNISVLGSILVRLASFFSDTHQAVLAATDLLRFVLKNFQKNEILFSFDSFEFLLMIFTFISVEEQPPCSVLNISLSQVLWKLRKASNIQFRWGFEERKFRGTNFHV